MLKGQQNLKENIRNLFLQWKRSFEISSNFSVLVEFLNDEPIVISVLLNSLDSHISHRKAILKILVTNSGCRVCHRSKPRKDWQLYKRNLKWFTQAVSSTGIFTPLQNSSSFLMHKWSLSYSPFCSNSYLFASSFFAIELSLEVRYFLIYLRCSYYCSL